MPMNIKNFIFDLDGTLVDSAPDLIHCLNQAYQALLPTRKIKVKPTDIGPPLPEMVKNLSPEIDSTIQEKLVTTFRHFYGLCGFKRSRLYPGIKKLLQKLNKKGCLLFIASNKPKRFSQQILQKDQLDIFTEIVGPDSIPGKNLNKKAMLALLIKKYCLEKAKTAMVGDMVSDLTAAKNNGIISIAVFGGYGDKKVLQAAQPDYSVEKPGDLNTLLL